MPTDLRHTVLATLHLLAHPSEQLKYEQKISGEAGHAPSELVSAYCDDLYHPKSQHFIDSFSDSELRDLAHLYGLIVEASKTAHRSVAEMQKDHAWRKVVALAKVLEPRFAGAA